MKKLTGKKHEEALGLYLILGALFIASLVSCNLIFQKFFWWNPLGAWSDYTFEISVGIIPYPLTFLVTDIISEVFGRKKANQVVVAGLVASIFVFLLILVADVVPATDWSPVSSNEFSHVFGKTGMAVFSSMMAYLLAQFIDVRVFHYIKSLTKGKHLWLRNNFSTITSQFVDTSVVLLLLCFSGDIAWSLFWGLFFNGVLFKMLVALVDTPLIYLGTYLIRKRYNLAMGEEIEL